MIQYTRTSKRINFFKSTNPKNASHTSMSQLPRPCIPLNREQSEQQTYIRRNSGTRLISHSDARLTVSQRIETPFPSYTERGGERGREIAPSAACHSHLRPTRNSCTLEARLQLGLMKFQEPTVHLLNCY